MGHQLENDTYEVIDAAEHLEDRILREANFSFADRKFLLKDARRNVSNALSQLRRAMKKLERAEKVGR